MLLKNIILKAEAQGISDIHFIVNLPIKFRKDGKLETMKDFEDILTDQICESYARELAGEDYEKISQIGELDLARSFDSVRVRGNIFRQQGHTSLSLRILSSKIPKLEDLGLPPAAYNFPNIQRGIVLVTGETGSGKSTTLAAIIKRINETRFEHIITLEDPIEYIHTPSNCAINQREIGVDTKSYADGLRAILREDPDIILIGEMRDTTTMEIALTAAETGHLVLATLHTNSAADAIDRLVDSFPEGRQGQIRLQLSMTLKAVLAQQLIPQIGGGRVAACELMIVTPAIKNLIREGKTPQIANSIATSANVGSITMDNALIKLAKAKVISKDEAMSAAHEVEYIQKNLLR